MTSLCKKNRRRVIDLLFLSSSLALLSLVIFFFNGTILLGSHELLGFLNFSKDVCNGYSLWPMSDYFFPPVIGFTRFLAVLVIPVFFFFGSSFLAVFSILSIYPVLQVLSVYFFSRFFFGRNAAILSGFFYLGLYAKNITTEVFFVGSHSMVFVYAVSIFFVFFLIIRNDRDILPAKWILLLSILSGGGLFLNYGLGASLILILFLLLTAVKTNRGQSLVIYCAATFLIYAILFILNDIGILTDPEMIRESFVFPAPGTEQFNVNHIFTGLKPELIRCAHIVLMRIRDKFQIGMRLKVPAEYILFLFAVFSVIKSFLYKGWVFISLRKRISKSDFAEFFLSMFVLAYFVANCLWLESYPPERYTLMIYPAISILMVCNLKQLFCFNGKWVITRLVSLLFCGLMILFSFTGIAASLSGSKLLFPYEMINVNGFASYELDDFSEEPPSMDFFVLDNINAYKRTMSELMGRGTDILVSSANRRRLNDNIDEYIEYSPAELRSHKAMIFGMIAADGMSFNEFVSSRKDIEAICSDSFYQGLFYQGLISGLFLASSPQVERMVYDQKWQRFVPEEYQYYFYAGLGHYLAAKYSSDIKKGISMIFEIEQGKHVFYASYTFFHRQVCVMEKKDFEYALSKSVMPEILALCAGNINREMTFQKGFAKYYDWGKAVSFFLEIFAEEYELYPDFSRCMQKFLKYEGRIQDYESAAFAYSLIDLSRIKDMYDSDYYRGLRSSFSDAVYRGMIAALLLRFSEKSRVTQFLRINDVLIRDEVIDQVCRYSIFAPLKKETEDFID